MINGESANSQDARLEELWRKLDTKGKGYLDLEALKQGLRKIDHPLKHANTLLEDVLKAIDTNSDGRISYTEFQIFVKQTEQELWNLFESIDRDGNGKLDKDELMLAFKGAGLSVSESKLQRFMDEIDSNHDGSVDFSEWRDFLLFIPATDPNLNQILSYFSSTVKLNPEGDVVITSDDKSQGIGYFIAGGAAGIISRTTTAPLDRLKVYLIAQTDSTTETLRAAKSGHLTQVLRGAWNTAAKAQKELWAAGGVRSLFAGNGLNVLKVMPESAIKFGCFEMIKSLYFSFGGQPDEFFLKFWAGGVSGMIAQFCVYPADTLKFRMQCETVSGGLRGNKLIITTARKMWQANGIRSYYRGVTLGVVGMFPYAAIDMGTYEWFKTQAAIYNAAKLKCDVGDNQAEPGSLQMAFVGAFSGALGASVVYPLNVLRTRLQSQGTVLHPRRYTGIMDVFRQTIKGEGTRGLYKGLAPNLLKVVPSVSISWVVYENCKRQMALK